MSYILSALKKAEQERHGGDVPDLMTPQPGDDIALPVEPSRWGSYFMVGGIAVIVLTVGVTVMRHFDSSVGGGSAAPPLASAPDLPLPDLPLREPTPTAQVPAPPAREPQLFPDRGDRNETETDFFAVAEPDANTPSANWDFDRILDINELSPSLRKHLPQLKLTGHLYSLAHPHARKVILNGVALKEKQYLDDTLMISEITPDGVILDFQGRLFRMGADQMFR